MAYQDGFSDQSCPMIALHDFASGGLWRPQKGKNGYLWPFQRLKIQNCGPNGYIWVLPLKWHIGMGLLSKVVLWLPYMILPLEAPRGLKQLKIVILGPKC